jgi:hypothetical protein
MADTSARFWAKVRKTESCWIWTGATSKGRGEFWYGSFWLMGRAQRAHVVAFRWFKGRVPRGKFVCHKCDRPLCVRPSHLFLGTPKINTQDALKKGRLVAHRGEAHGRAILTRAAVEEIRRSRETDATLGARYGVHSNTVNRVRRYETWREVPNAA